VKLFLVYPKSYQIVKENEFQFWIMVKILLTRQIRNNNPYYKRNFIIFILFFPFLKSSNFSTFLFSKYPFYSSMFLTRSMQKPWKKDCKASHGSDKLWQSYIASAFIHIKQCSPYTWDFGLNKENWTIDNFLRFDFWKAYNNIIWNFLFKALEKLGMFYTSGLYD